MNRAIRPELLDTLPPEDPRAVRSRRDLRRVNNWMRNHRIAARTLQQSMNGHRPGRIVDLGAGDGDFLLRTGRRLATSWTGVTATLLDRQRMENPQVSTSFANLGWRAEWIVSDVIEWAHAAKDRETEVILANLFLHHFGDAKLIELFEAIAHHARVFIAVEPRRSRWSLVGSRLLWAIGCNTVTRHDAAVSVRAGFRQRELTSLWPAKRNWRLAESASGPFSHLFVAQRLVNPQ